MASEQPERATTLGAAKALPFGWCLRQAIKAEFETSRAFAQRLGVTEGRISQILSGQETITAVTLETLVSCFEDFGRQEALRQAWLDTFVPSTLELIEPTDEDVDRLLGSIPTLIAEGRARPTLATLGRLYQQATDQDLRFRLAKAVIDLLLFRGQAHQALRWSESLVAQAQDAREPGWSATALWTSATAGRIAPGLATQRIIQLHERSVEFVASWMPSSQEGRELAAGLQESICRDRALTLLSIHEKRPVSQEVLGAAVTQLDDFLARDLKPDTRAVFEEVKGRALLAIDDRAACEESLDVLAPTSQFVSLDFEIKTAILRARLRLAQGKVDEAQTLLQGALEQGLVIDAWHHGQVIERLLTGL